LEALESVHRSAVCVFPNDHPIEKVEVPVAGGIVPVALGPRGGSHAPALEFVRHRLAQYRWFRACSKDQHIGIVVDLAAGVRVFAGMDHVVAVIDPFARMDPVDGMDPVASVREHVVADTVATGSAVVDVAGRGLAVVDIDGTNHIVAGRGMALVHLAGRNQVVAGTAAAGIAAAGIVDVDFAIREQVVDEVGPVVEDTLLVAGCACPDCETHHAFLHSSRGLHYLRCLCHHAFRA
jgi:hypothetical protein